MAKYICGRALFRRHLSTKESGFFWHENLMNTRSKHFKSYHVYMLVRYTASVLSIDAIAKIRKQGRLNAIFSHLQFEVGQ